MKTIFKILTIVPNILFGQETFNLSFVENNEIKLEFYYTKEIDYKMYSTKVNINDVEFNILLINQEGANLNDSFIATLPESQKEKNFVRSATIKNLKEVGFLKIKDKTYEINQDSIFIRLIGPLNIITDTAKTLFYFDYTSLNEVSNGFNIFENKTKKKKTVIYFYEDFCSPCVEKLPVFFDIVNKNLEVEFYVFSKKNTSLIGYIKNNNICLDNLHIISYKNDFDKFMQVNGFPYIIIYDNFHLIKENLRLIEKISNYL